VRGHRAQAIEDLIADSRSVMERSTTVRGARRPTP
jgi:hypothetical protein